MTRFSVLSSTCESECSLPQALAYLDLEIFFVPIPSSLAILSFPPKPQVGKNRKKRQRRTDRSPTFLHSITRIFMSWPGAKERERKEKYRLWTVHVSFLFSFSYEEGQGTSENNLENKIPNSPRGTQRLWTSGTRNTVHTHTVPEKKRRKSESSLFFLWLPRKMQFSLSFICSRGPPFLLLLLLFFTLLFHRAFGKKEGVGERKCMHREQAALARNSGTRNPRSEFRPPLFDKYVLGESSKHLKR